jgi:hypothetical protein
MDGRQPHLKHSIAAMACPFIFLKHSYWTIAQNSGNNTLERLTPAAEVPGAAAYPGEDLPLLPRFVSRRTGQAANPTACSTPTTH